MSGQDEPQRQLQISIPEVKQEQAEAEEEGEAEGFFTPNESPNSDPSFGDLVANQGEGLAQMFQPSQLYHTGEFRFPEVFNFRDVKQELRGACGQASSQPPPPIVDFQQNNPLSQLLQPMTPPHINPLELLGSLGHDYLGERDRADLSGDDSVIVIAQHTGLPVDECRARIRTYEEYCKLIDTNLKDVPISTQEELLAFLERLATGYSLKYGLLGELSTNKPDGPIA